MRKGCSLSVLIDSAFYAEDSSRGFGLSFV